MAKGISSAKLWGSVLLAAVVVGAIGAGGAWYYMDTQLQAANTRATSLQSQLASQAGAVTAATLTLSNNGQEFTFDTAIDANGGVSGNDNADESTAPTFSCWNNDTNDDAVNCYLTMYDLESSDGGLGTILEDEDASCSFYVTVNGVRTPLYTPEGGYTSGVLLGTIAKNGGMAGPYTLTAILDSATDDTYPDDGSDITIYAYIYQASAQDATRLAYTFST